MQIELLAAAFMDRLRGALFRRTSGVFLVSLWCLSPAYGQVSAVLTGTVLDQSGAVVSAANVTAKNVDTGAARVTATDACGRYQFPALPVGE